MLLLALVTCAAASTLIRDVVVIGGGASGAHAALRLRDMNRTVLLVEQAPLLGGHVDSFADAATGVPHDYGVLSFNDIAVARPLFARLGIPVAPFGRTPATTLYADFSTGRPVDFTPPAQAAQSEALSRYLVECEKYERFLLPGYFDFPAPQDIPGDLLLPFHDFIRKHRLEDAVPRIFSTTGLGIGNIMDELTMYVMQVHGAPMARAMLGRIGAIVPASGRNQDVYDAIAKELGPEDVLLDTTVIEAHRGLHGVRLTVQNRKTKERTVIKANKLLMAIVPSAANMRPFAADAREKAVLSKFHATRIYTGIVTNEALPVNHSLYNVPASAAPNITTELPRLPFNGRFDYMGQGEYFRITAMVPADTGATAAQAVVQRNFDNLIKGSVVPTPRDAALKWVALSDHGYMHMRASAEDVKGGFIQEQYALQGHRSTWWTGATFSVNFQTTLWEFNEVLLPRMLATI